MKARIFILFIFLFVNSILATAQSNSFTGTWQMEMNQAAKMPMVLTLQISKPDKNLLFPAHLTITAKDSTVGFDLLLVKKNSRQLAISKAKYAEQENNISLDFFNGTLDLSRDLKGLPNLHLIPLNTKQQQSDTRLVKINDSAWEEDDIEKILQPSISPVYFGLTDTIYVNNRNGNFNLTGIQKNDIVSATLNGNTIVDLYSPSKKNHIEDLQLDTGMNILVLFADNFGNSIANKATMAFVFGQKKFKFDFNTKADSAAAFIAAKIYYDPAKENETYFREYPIDPKEILNVNDKIIGSISSTSRQVQLAIWDDAVEDGDSISININGEWITRGFPVKKSPQFLTVTLKPGQNAINFIADNVGSIPPNTSVLEIIDGKKRKAYTLETVPGDNNFVKIYYDTGVNKP
ncbi:MAG: hypothetical protein ABI091_11975 [Ferruginibacter sp.]